jgi:hypothetical protein
MIRRAQLQSEVLHHSGNNIARGAALVWWRLMYHRWRVHDGGAAIGIGAHVQRNSGSRNPLIYGSRPILAITRGLHGHGPSPAPTRRVWPGLAWDFDAASQSS